MSVFKLRPLSTDTSLHKYIKNLLSDVNMKLCVMLVFFHKLRSLLLRVFSNVDHFGLWFYTENKEAFLNTGQGLFLIKKIIIINTNEIVYSFNFGIVRLQLDWASDGVDPELIQYQEIFWQWELMQKKSTKSCLYVSALISAF